MNLDWYYRDEMTFLYYFVGIINRTQVINLSRLPNNHH